MKNGKLRIVFGIVLLLVQLFSIIGMSSMGPDRMELWEGEKGHYTAFTKPTDLKFSHLVFGFQLGFDKFGVSIEGQFQEIDEWYDAMIDDQLLSYMIRSGLKNKGEDGKSELFRYDLAMFLGYALVGIVGLVLVIWGILAGRKPKRSYPWLDEGETVPGKILRIAGIVLTVAGGVFCWNQDWILLAAMVCLVVFFAGYFGRKPSVLVFTALILAGVEILMDGVGYFVEASQYQTQSAKQTVLYMGLASLACSALYLVSGVLLSLGKSKWFLRILAIPAVILIPLVAVIWYQSAKILPPSYLLEKLEFGKILFSLTVVAYAWAVKTQPAPQLPQEEPPKPVIKSHERVVLQQQILPEVQQEHMIPSTAEGCCRGCGAKLNAGRTHCMRCGTKVEQPQD